MEYDISVSDKKSFLRICVNEAVTAELLQDFIYETANKSKEYGIDNFLFDLRQAPNQTGLGVHYKFVYERSRELGYKLGSKHALLVAPEDMNTYDFVETILINAGYRSKMFADELAAIEWLEK